jgi:hypothetical protein
MGMDIELDQRAIRRFLGVRLIDLEAVTGIAAARIGAAERGVQDLRPAEQRIISNFLRQKLASAMERE